ncbi:MAG: HIT family protein [Gammaproteobacteria bacterium]|nr:HIT family protein [Gammaproteobacteria bacterium]
MDKTDTKMQTAVERSGFDPHTVFMKILAGDLPATFVHRDELVSAFMDIQPVNTGHVLIVPNIAIATLAELDAETGARLFHVGQRIGAAVRRTDIACEGVNLFLADGVAAGQTVYHVHLHVLPRFENDGFRFQFPQGYYDPPSHEAIEHAAEKIRSALANEGI